MDQTPLPFILDDGTTYEHQGSKDVCCKSGAPGLEKRQATAQIIAFADGIPRVKPLMILKGKGLIITAEDKKAWDSRVLCFSKKTPGAMSRPWLNGSNPNGIIFCLNPSTPGSDGKILVAGKILENVK